MSDAGYFDSVSANLKAGVGGQLEGVKEGAKSNSENGVSPSVNALDTGIKAATAISGLADGLCEAAMLPLLGALGMKGMACLPISKQLDPVIGVDVHIVNIPPSPAVPLPHPYVGVLLCPKDFLAAAIATYIPPPPTPEQAGSADGAALAGMAHMAVTMAVGMLGATVKIGGFIPRAVASTPTQSVPHIPLGAGWSANSAPIPKNNGHAFMGSLTVLADGMPFSGGGAHLHLDCNDVGIPSVHKVPGLFLPTGVINPIPQARQILTSPVPTPVNPMAALAQQCKGAFGRFYKKKTQKLADKLHSKVNDKIKSSSLKNMLHKAICTVTGHPVDVASGTFFTDEEDFWLDGPVPLSWERTWYSRSDYSGPLGNGWHHAYDMGVVADHEAGTLTLRMSDGIPVAFPLPAPGHPSFILSERKEASVEDGIYTVWDMADDLRYRFTARAYDSVHLLESVTDRNGLGIRLEYTREGWLSAITDSAGRRLTVWHDTRSGRILEIRGPHPTEPGREMTLAEYRYDADGNMTHQRNAVGDTMEYAYSGRLIVMETWRNGLRWYFEYDGDSIGSRCVHTWGDGGIYDHKLTFLEGVTEVLDSNDELTVYHHRDGLVWKKVDANGGEHLWRYDDSRQLLEETDPEGGSTLYRYDRWGNLTDSSDPCGGSVSAVYPRKGALCNLPLSVTTPDGGTWEFGYDRKGNMVSRTNPAGAVTRMSYRDGLVSAVTGPYGVVSELEYDAHRNLTGVSDSLGNRASYGYDGLGRCVRVTNPRGAVQRREHDLIGRVTRVLDFDGNDIRLSYDGIDNLVEYRDSLQHVEYGYSGMWKLTRRRDHRGVVNFRYDREERLVRVINERLQSYEFTLDAVGNVTSEKGFDGEVRRYLRDRGGRVVRETLPSGIERHYTYDACSRVTEVSYPTAGEESSHYAYGLSGRLTEARRGGSLVRFTYDGMGLPISESSGDGTIRRTFDMTGRILTLDSTAGASLRYSRDSLGMLSVFSATTAGDGVGEGSTWESGHRHDSLGQEVERLLPGGIVRSFAYDDLGRLVDTRTRRDSRTRHMRRYRWGLADRLLSVDDSLRGETRYRYTPTGQLETAEYPDGREEWRKSDSVGNLYPDPEMKYRRYLSGGRLEQDGEWHCRYDADGNLVERHKGTGGWLGTKRERWRYRWNADGSLRSVTRPDGEEVVFGYDALGRRLSKGYRGTETRWLWDGNVPLHQWRQRREYSVEAGGWRTEEGRGDMTLWLFEEGSFVPAAMVRGGRTYSLVTDQLGTPTEAYDSEGNQVWGRVLDMDGRVIEETGNVGMVPFLFQGQYYDRETGLAYNRFRYYDPSTGAYISQDPVGLASGMLNLYGYVDDTNSWIDIFGLAPWGRGDQAFEVWWNNATSNVVEENIRSVKAHLRGKGGMHEMYPVSLAPKLRDLGFTASELKEMVIPTKGMAIKIGKEKGLHHRSRASSLFHKKLVSAVEGSSKKSHAQRKIQRLHEKHVVGYADKK